MDVYAAREVNFYKEISDEAYTRLFKYPRITDKPHFQLYQHPYKDAYVIAIRGTVLTDKYDLQADALLAVNNTNTARFNEIRDFIRLIRRAYPKKQIILVGHSLGGSIASVVSEEFGLQSVSFNAGQPLFKSVPVSENQVHYFNSGDIISNRNRTESKWNVQLDVKKNAHALENASPIKVAIK